MKISKTVYACKEKDICLPRCPPFSFFRGGCHDRCDDCPPQADCPSCGHPRTVAVLMKKVVTTECPTTKCVVSHQEAHCAPVCPPACTTGGHASLPTTTTPVATTPATTLAMPTGAAPVEPINLRPRTAPRGSPAAPPTLIIEGVR
jgi:hypothetical protein